MPSSTYPTQGSSGQIRPTYCFSKKKQRETIKIIPCLAFILVPKNGPTTKIKKKKSIVVTKELDD
jgi:hypothetical protein